MKCPVCRNLCDADAHRCPICGFNRINIDFLNVDDAEAWKRSVKFAKVVWFMNEDDESFVHFNPECNTDERTLLQLNSYFDYSEQLNHITMNPDDFLARSWFVDCLREIYVLTGTFPLTSRKYVKTIIEDQMSYFDRNAAKMGRKSEYIHCEHLIHKAEMALADCDFTEAFLYYQHYLFEIKRLKDRDYLAMIEEGARVVLHNCHVLSEFLCVSPRICDALDEMGNQYYDHDTYRSADGQDLLKRIKERENRAIFVHTLGCGLSGAYYTDKDDAWQMKTHQATFESCCFDYNGVGHYNACDFSMDCQPLPIEHVDGLWYRIEYVTEAFNVSDVIYSHKDAVENMARELLSIGNLFE